MLNQEEWENDTPTETTGGDDNSKMEKWNMGKLRPQILVAILCATIFSVFALWMGYKMDATEIVTAVIGGIFGFLGGVSLKVLENE